MSGTEGYGELASDLTVDTTAHLASLSLLQAQHALALDALAAAQSDLESNAIAILTLEAEVARLEAEVERLEDIINPPPATRRVLDNYLLAGGGGVQCAEVLRSVPYVSLPAVIGGTDVGGAWRLRPDSWELEKWNLGFAGRHVASETVDAETGEIVMHGAPGSNSGTAQEGVYILDLLGEDWNGPLPGSKNLFLNGQNSSSWDGWKHGYGPNFEQRSVGRLTWRRADGSLVCGQFGYATAGRGGVAILSPSGAKRVIAGTEDWACRAVEQMSDTRYLVSVEKAEAPSALPSPGGLWAIDLGDDGLARLTDWPDTPEHIASNSSGTRVVAMRNAGIWRDGQDASFNLAKGSEWYSCSIDAEGNILAGCMNPAQGPDGRFWSFVELLAGSTVWRNRTPRKLAGLTDAHPSLNSSEPFVAPNRGGTLGMSGATVTTTLYRGSTPMCLSNGIVWAWVDGETRPAPGTLIVVNRDYDRNADGWEVAAESDFNAHYRKPGGRMTQVNFAGENDGAQVRWVGHVIHYAGPNGERQTFNVDTGTFASTTAPMPPHNPEGPMTPATRAAILATPEVKQFGERHGTFAIDAETLVIYGHGAGISRMVPTE